MLFNKNIILLSVLAIAAASADEPAKEHLRGLKKNKNKNKNQNTGNGAAAVFDFSNAADGGTFNVNKNNPGGVPGFNGEGLNAQPDQSTITTVGAVDLNRATPGRCGECEEGFCCPSFGDPVCIVDTSGIALAFCE
mmetsp:Transcript_39258/g.80441  ORF Transcript_39258/g.80441 Transcript_39258/m.80441 type:complete len:136 (+) Transcript_39258:780-1187(+)|eukprot:CAMPEP_0178480486 /NCGR_PEP_ID=MMETSP0696-20121128/5724_1 /TAXON_ID=265572 /ORGANISM="Extubocellulus spinifer, Strain CCMP396" /LENGTH=135 /DNA_ID=CAMNT_0020107935 /DNA_START=8 /DNA_END=415 /DNA_ORIENTATION=-